jgi:hypothetical protein
MNVVLNVKGIEGVLATLESLPAEIVSKKGGPVKTSLRKGAVVLLKAEQATLAAATSNATSTGKSESTGLLAKNIIVTRGKPPFSGKGERYLVRIRRKVYTETPDGLARKGKPTTTLLNAQRLEYGSRDGRQRPEPFIRPAFLSKASEAITTVQTELVAAVNRVVAQLARQNTK